MSEYFGLKDDQSVTRLTSGLNTNVLLDGPATENYGNYVRNVFRHGADLSGVLSENHSVSATTMLRMEDNFGPSALDDSYDEEILKDPLEKLYSEMGLSNFSSASRHYPVYVPKQSSEYFSTLYSKKRPEDEKYTYISYRNSKAEKDVAEEQWRRNNKQFLVDYKDFDSPRLSPYMYQEHPYVQVQDSRIVGSNFVQITSRPKDNFLEKIDKTLAEIRAEPRF